MPPSPLCFMPLFLAVCSLTRLFQAILGQAPQSDRRLHSNPPSHLRAASDGGWPRHPIPLALKLLCQVFLFVTTLCQVAVDDTAVNYI